MTNPTEKLLTEAGVEWRRQPVSVESINRELSLDNQVRKEALNSAVIDDYAAAMERGDIFPPVIVAERDGQRWLLGGNHRWSAALQADIETLDAYLVVNPSDGQSRRIAFGDNSTHGQPLTNKERIAHAEWLMEHESMSQKDAAAHVGISTNRLQRHLAVRATRHRASALMPNEYNLIPGVSSVSLSRLANLRDDDTFVTMTRAVATYAIPTNTVLLHVTYLNKIKDVDKQRQEATKIARDHAAAGSRNTRKSGHSKRNELHRLSDALMELASVDFDRCAYHVKEGDEPVWDRRLKEAAQNCFNLRNQIVN